MNEIATVDIARRFEENPLFTPGRIKPGGDEVMVESVINPGVFRFKKKIWLLARVVERARQTAGWVNIATRPDGDIEVIRFSHSDPELDWSDSRRIVHARTRYPSTLSHLRLLCSDDGKDFHLAEDFEPILGDAGLGEYGVLDCRVTEINEVYYLTYTMVSADGTGVGLIQTRDWRRLERKGMIFPPSNQHCAIFEEKIRDRYFALHCPGGSRDSAGNAIWIAESPDCVHWGHHTCVAKTREGMWDSARVGAGCSPVQTPQGWLAIYHGVNDQNRCCLGALLLDLSEPSRVIARSAAPFMEPTEPYESGANGSGVFTNGHLVNGDKLQLYYGAGAQVICGAEFSIKEILGSLVPQKKL